MKWKDITKNRGDDGYTSFQGSRKAKSNAIFDLLGEIDTLNAQLGIMSVPFNDFGAMFQRMNRQVMGKLHNPKSTIEDWETLVDQLLANITTALDESGTPLDGWIDYDNHLFVICCQIRKVERLFCKYANKQKTTDIASFIRLYNRLSKVFYCLGAEMTHARKKLEKDFLDNADKMEDNGQYE